jgi:hypothetical protein
MRNALTFLALALACAPALIPDTALAQDYDDLEDLDNSGAKKKKKKKRGKSYNFDDVQVKEVARGFYAKTNMGGWIYLGNFAGYVKPGTSMALAIGQDFVDNESNSMAWEVAFFQGIHNGMHYELQADDPGSPKLQGDLRTYSGVAALEWSAYPGRRFGLGGRVGGGVLFSPLLIDDVAWETDVVPNAFRGEDRGHHSGPKPLVMVGPTFEYYTKMSHFSVGIDVDAIYVVTFDFGLSTTGTIKYTF